MARWLWAVVPLRILLDLGAGWSFGPLSVAQLGHGVLFVALAASVRWRRAGTHPVAPWLAAYALLVALGALRAAPFDAIRYGLHLLTPVVWLLAIHSADELSPRIPRSWWAAALVPIGCSAVALAAGQPAANVLHGWPRLIGAYANLHSHASAMAVFAGVAWLGARGDRLRTTVAVGASVAVALTFVRAAWLWVGLAGWLFLLIRGRRGLALGLVAAAALALLLPPVHARFADLWSIATLTAPDGGWGALGSWRGRIWVESIATWLAGPPLDVLLGRGLGGQYGLHRHLEVHSDWLAVLVQLGPLGFAAWIGLNGALVRQLARRGRLGAEAFALLVAAIALAAVSNDWLARGTPLLWTYGWVGWALRSPPRGTAAPPAPRTA